VRVYLDYNASAPLRPEARAAMTEAAARAGNPSSAHREGAAARRLVEDARAAVAALVGAEPAEIVFTSGATEANNLALRGTVAGRSGAGIVTTAIEHASVLGTAAALAALGCDAVHVAVDDAGCVATADVVRTCSAATALVSVGLANGEVGVVAPVAEIAAALRGRDVLLHTDAAQAAGRIPIDVRALGVDLLSLSAHKLGGPTGVGALWIRRGRPLHAEMTGGPQERGRRAGTENVVGIAGFGAAADVARRELSAAATRMDALRARLWDGLRASFPDVVLNGPASGPRLPNTLNVTIPGCDGESLVTLLDLDGVAASLGSACAAGSAEPSHVLRAMGRSDAGARHGLRLSLGPGTTAAEIERALEILPRAVAQVRREAAA
jgi:cysteine desulfurase